MTAAARGVVAHSARPDQPDEHAGDEPVALEGQHVARVRDHGEHRSLDVLGDPARVRRRGEDVAGADQHVGRDAVEDLERVGAVVGHAVLVEADDGVARAS